MRTFVATIVLLALTACADPERAPRLNQEGDPCRASQAICVDDETARECIDGSWTDQDCDETCVERGPAMLSEGCQETPIEGCVCVPEPGACAPGSTACESDAALGYCDDDQVWAIYECTDLCAASLATPVSLGCELGDRRCRAHDRPGAGARTVVGPQNQLAASAARAYCASLRATDLPGFEPQGPHDPEQRPSCAHLRSRAEMIEAVAWIRRTHSRRASSDHRE